MVSSCDLASYLDENYFSNRPTGLGISEGTLYLATACFNPPVTYEKAEMKVFSEINKILILSGSADTCSFEVLHHAKTLMPYYDTNISISGDKYLYFQDGNKIVSNINNIESCAIKEKSIYPYLLAGNSFVYASILNKYKIRDFNTKVSACIKIKDKDEN